MRESLRPNDDRDEKPEQKPENVSRRAFLGGASAAALSIAANAIPKNANAMGSFGWILGNESEEKLKSNLEDRMHAAHMYMDHHSGKLKENLMRLEHEVGSKIVNGTYDQLLPKDRKIAEELDKRSIFDERARVLAELDEELLPELLVTYVQKGISDKTLVKVYAELGGDLEAIRQEGYDGVDEHLIDMIASNITYSIGTIKGRGDFGKASYNALTFVKKLEPTTK